MSKELNNKINFNFQNMNKIDKKYDDVITKIIVYIRVKLSEKDAEEAINDILDMLLGAQNRGEDLYTIIGNDYKVFCDEIIKSYSEENKWYFLLKFKEIAIVVLAMFPFFIALNCIAKIGSIKPFSINALYNAHYNLDIIPIVGIFIAMPIVYFLLNYIAENPEKDNKKDLLIFFIVQIVNIGVLVAIGYYFRKVVLLSIPNYFVCFIISIIVLIGYIIYLTKSLKEPNH